MSKKKGSSQRVVALCLAALVCFFLVHRSYDLAPGMWDRAASYLAFPLLQFQNKVLAPVALWVSEWQRKSIIEKAYWDVVAERDLLRAHLIDLEATKTFSDETEEIRSFRSQYNTSRAVLARVLLYHHDAHGCFLMIDTGANKGLHKDTPVVYQNCLVGKVAEVYPYHSKVVLLSDRTCKVAAYCDITGTPGIFEGIGDAHEGILAHVGHLSQVQEGDLVFSSGEGMVFPKGFAIGTVRSFCKNEGDMQYSIAVSLLVDFSTIRYCYVLEKS